MEEPIKEEVSVVEEPIVKEEVVNVKREIAEEITEIENTKEEIVVEEVAETTTKPDVTTTVAAVVDIEKDNICVLEDGCQFLLRVHSFFKFKFLAARTNGFHRYENSCTKFYECKDGAQMLEVCLFLSFQKKFQNF